MRRNGMSCGFPTIDLRAVILQDGGYLNETPGRALPAMFVADHRFWRSAALPFVEARCASASRNSYIPHAHDSLSIGSVEGGESAFSLRDVERRLGPGDVVLIPPGAVHCCNPANDGRWSYRMLHLDPAWVTDVIGEWRPFAAGVFDGFPDAAIQPLVHSRLIRFDRPPVRRCPGRREGGRGGAFLSATCIASSRTGSRLRQQRWPRATLD